METSRDRGVDSVLAPVELETEIGGAVKPAIGFTLSVGIHFDDLS